MSRWRAVIFDLDDTLYPERDYVLSGFQAVANWVSENLGPPAEPAYRSLVQLFEQGVRGDTFDRWLAAHGLNASLAPRMVEVYRAHNPRIRPFPRIPPLLAALHGKVRLGLISDGYLSVQRRKLLALGLGTYFSAVVFTDELGREHWKPSTLPFVRACELLEVPLEDAVYVADNCAKDFIGARRAGLSTIWIRHAVGDYSRRSPPTPLHAANVAVDNIEELWAVLE